MARANWGKTAAIMATIVNVNRGKKPAVKPDRFNPFTPRRMVSTDELRVMLGD